MRPFERHLVALICVVAASAFAARADERLTRTFGYESGLSASAVNNLIQDRTGFLWIATPSGVFRFDGREFRRLTSKQAVIVSPIVSSDDVYFVDGDGDLWRASVPESERIRGDDGALLPRIDAAVMSEDETLWVHPAGTATLLKRKPGGRWQSIDIPTDATAHGVLLFPGRGDSVLVLDDEGVLRVGGDGARSRILAAENVVRVKETLDGAMLYALWGSNGYEVGELRGGIRRGLFQSSRRLVDFATRGDSVWIAFDAELDVVRPDGQTDSIGRADGLRGCNALLVDREGSLWVASYEAGVVQYPEPDTVLRELPGFVPAVRSLVATKQGVWAGGWFGTEYLDLSSGPPGTLRRGPTTLNFPSPAGEDAIWTIVERDTLSLWGPEGERRRLRFPGLNFCRRGAAARDGGLWIPTNIGILHASGDTRDVRLAIGEFPVQGTTPGDMWAVLEKRGGELFVAKEGTVCHGEPGAWHCSAIDGVTKIVGFAETPSGDVWLASVAAGLYRLAGEKWERLAGSDLLPSLILSGLSPGADGTFWISGSGVAVRVAERRDRTEGLAIVERLSAWQGMPSLSVSDVIEETDGDLYVGSAGILFTPSSSRHIAAEPPTVVLVSATADGQPLPRAQSVDLPYRRNRLELRFAALSYRDPARILYRTRLRTDEPWSKETTEPSLRFVDLAPGAYDVEIQATLDGERWTTPPAQFRFHVARPWYLQPWFFALAACAIGGAVYGAVRLRVAQLLRLERQRARIAMDLHDELGSGLGSIGLLSAVLSRAGLDAERRLRAGTQLAEIASGLSASLTDIVWSLKPGAATLESLAAHLLARGGALFPDDQPHFVSEIPSTLPPVALSLAVRRNVFLIGLEGLHNAAEHSRASEVRLSLRSEGRSWRLTIVDDGTGLPATPVAAPSGATAHGLGLDSMRRRAREIRATLTWTATSRGGTTVSLLFAPQAEGRALTGR